MNRREFFRGAIGVVSGLALAQIAPIPRWTHLLTLDESCVEWRKDHLEAFRAASRRYWPGWNGNWTTVYLENWDGVKTTRIGVFRVRYRLVSPSTGYLDAGYIDALKRIPRHKYYRLIEGEWT